MKYFKTTNTFLIISFVTMSLAGHSVPVSPASFIQKIDVDKKILNYDGSLPASAVPKVLSQAFLEKKISDPAFNKDSCLKVKSIAIVGSFNTKQLFSIESSCDASKAPISYIAKEAVHGEKEALSLKEIEKTPGMKALLAPAKPPQGLLGLALPVAYLSYEDNNGMKHYLAIMPYAPGRVLCDVVKDFGDAKKPENAKRLEKAYKNLGTQLGNFHRRFMKSPKKPGIGETLLHGDLHCLNIFYDEKTGLTTLIDNETIADYIKNPRTPDDDILKLFFGPFSKSEPESRKDLIKGIDLETWFQKAFSNFVEGYAENVPQSQKAKVYEDLKKIFNTDQKLAWQSISPETLKDLREKYINPILDKKLGR